MNKWDVRFGELAYLVAGWSKDPSTQCGAVIVRPDKTVASTGFNGFPKQIDDHAEYYENREQKYARMIHAELNAILHAREPLEGYTIYTAQFPPIGPACDRCAAHIIQSGIKRVVFTSLYNFEVADRWKHSLELAEEMFIESRVKVDRNIYELESY